MNEYPDPDGHRRGMSPEQYNSRNNGHRDDKADPNRYDHDADRPPPDNLLGLGDPQNPNVLSLEAGGSKGAVRVNSLMLKRFSDNLRTIAEPLKISQQELADVSVRPGTFPTAMRMRKAVNSPEGDSALARTLTASFVSLYNGLTELADALAKIAKDYDSTEELNKLDLQKYKQLVDEANGYLTKMNTGGGAKA